LLGVPDEDFPTPEIGFGIGEVDARGRGYAHEGVGLLIVYLFAGYATPCVTAFTDVENLAARRVLEHLQFQREGVLRRITFRDGRWCDIAVYGLLGP
jgi:RimJ/RimL family protein N-acetyltransferase